MRVGACHSDRKLARQMIFTRVLTGTQEMVIKNHSLVLVRWSYYI